MEEENQRLKKQLEELTLKYQCVQQENNELRTQASTNKIITHPVTFWSNVKLNCTKPKMINTLKRMVKSKEMTVNDMNSRDETLLIIAAAKGSYDLVQFLINNVESCPHASCIAQ